MLQSMRSAAKWIWFVIAAVFIGGFVFYQSSGLFGRTPVTTTTAVAKVNGREILYQTYAAAVENLSQQQESRLGRALTLDERKQLQDQAFDQLVTDALLAQEYRRRNIRVSDDEIRLAALNSPPPQLQQAPELQTDGRFDIDKYRRFVNSPAARQQGLTYQLEQYYRSEIPKQKLFEQVASDVYVTEPRLWQLYQDTHDSAQVSYVAFRPELVADNAVTVSDDEIRSYYDAHRNDLTRPGRAVVSVVSIPRSVTAADSAAARARAIALRDEIASGRTKFEDVARRESADEGSAANGGDLGSGGRGRFVAEFEKAAYALQPGEISQPVQTGFGYHIIRLDQRKGDTLSLHHVLVKIAQSDSSATAADRRADQLSKLAASSDQPARFDAAARQLGLTVSRGVAIEGDPLTIGGRYVPSVSAWAFGGAKPGESSELIDVEDGYYLARLDSLAEGGKLTLEQSKSDIRTLLARRKKVDGLVAQASQLLGQARSSSLEAAAQARGLQVTQSPLFSRVSAVPGIGQANEAIGAAFATPVGQLTPPIRTENGVFVLRVDRRVEANRAEFDRIKRDQREQFAQALRQQRLRDYLAALRASATIEDNRKEIEATARRQSA